MKLMAAILWCMLAAQAVAGDAISPLWSMGAARTKHASVLLPSGKVLVIGGSPMSSGQESTCELFDPIPGTWTPTGSMVTARSQHGVVLLRSGQVLVAGGSGRPERYDPVSGTWAQTGTMVLARGNPTLTLLASGKVLAVGGSADCELYDPVTDAWTATGTMSTVRFNHTATALPDGRVLVAGGTTTANGITPLATCELWDPVGGAWSSANAMSFARGSQSGRHAATLLASGKVLVSGGATYLTACELYDPGTNVWASAGNMSNARANHSSTLLASGRVLVAGDSSGATALPTEVYNPIANSWSNGPSLATHRGLHTATLLPSGQVAIIGGQVWGGTGLASAELYTPESGAWQTVGSLHTNTIYPSLVLLPSGKALAVGNGWSSEFDPDAATWLRSGDHFLSGNGLTTTLLGNGKVLAYGWGASLYDPATRAWTSVGGQITPRDEGHTATQLPSGQVLIVGGTWSGMRAECQLYDPATNAWQATGSTAQARAGHAAVLLPTGEVLVTGGTAGASGYSNQCELYNPISGLWRTAPAMPSLRRVHTATLLNTGRVLVVGGTPTGVLSSELYDPQANAWSMTAAPSTYRTNHTASLLPGGQVLIAGGGSDNLLSCQVYDPLSATWRATAAMAGGHEVHGAVVLTTGAVLVVAGRSSSGYQPLCEVFTAGEDASRRSVVTSATVAATIAASGSGFFPVLGAGSGQPQASPGAAPVMQWSDAAGSRIWRIGAVGAFTDAAVASAIPMDACGPGWLRAVVNGIPGRAAYAPIPLPTVTLSTSAAVISENGGSASVTATLSRAVARPVVVGLQTGGTAVLGTDYACATSIIIPAGSLNAAITLTATPDMQVEAGGETVVIDVATVLNGSESGTQQATITITDYQTPGFAVSAISRHTTEAGQTATFTVRPSSPPQASTSVTLSLASTDSTEGVVSGGSSLVFTPADWTSAQTVTVTGIDDAIDDGNITFQIIGSASSGDPDYDNRAMPAVTVVNDDDDSAGIAFAAPVGFITEGGGAATVGISLTSQPTTNVSLGLASSASTQGTVGTTSLLFTTANWNIPQSVTVTGADGDGADNPESGTTFSLVATVTSGPGEYPTSITASRTLTCYPSNAAPAITAILAQTIDEDSVGTVVNLSGIAAGGNETQVLTVTAVSSDPAILPHPAVNYTSAGATGSLTLVPVAQAIGAVTVTVRVTDDAGIGRAGAKDAARFTEVSFTVTVGAINDAPVLSGATTTLQAQVEDDLAAPGTLVGAILGGLTITDADPGALRGLAIIAADTTHGTWWYNIGAGWNGIGTVSAVQARLLADDGTTKLRFVPAGNFTGTADLTIRAWDRTAGSNGGLGDAGVQGGATAFSTASATARVAITPVNDAPVLASTTGRPLNPVTGGQPNPGTPVASLIAGLVSDVDGDPQGVAITAITGGGGTWEGSTDSGATWIDLATAIGGQALLLSDAGSMLVRYRPQANEAGTASLTFHAWDRSDGRTPGVAYAIAGTAYSAIQATSAVTVSSGNAAPVLTMPTSLLAYVENQAARQLDAAATVTDGDSGDFLGGALTASIIVGASAEDALSVAPVGGVTLAGSTVRVGAIDVASVSGGSGSTPLVLTWNANAGPVEAQAVLAALSYRNLSDNPSTAVRIVRVQMTDGDGGTSFPVTVTVTVAAVNDQPVIGGTAAVGPYIEDADPLPLAPAATVADPDSPTFASGTLSVSLVAGGEASDVLAVAPGGSLGLAGGEVSWNGTVFGTVSGGSGTATPLVVLFDGDATQAAVQGLLRGLVFKADSQHPSAATRTVRLRLADGAGAVSNDVDIAVTVQPENDAPTAAPVAWQVNPSTLNYLPAVQLGLADADAPPAGSVVATITGLPAAGDLTVRGVTAAAGSTFTWQDLLDQEVRYLSPAAEGTRTLSFTLGDGAVVGIGPYHLAIQVTGTISNLPPVLGLSGGAVWQEALPPVSVDPYATVVDSDSSDFDGGEVSAAVTLGTSAADRLAIGTVGGVTLSGTDVLVSSVAVGVVSGGTGGMPLTVSLNANATPARVERVVRAISFAVSGTKPTTDQRIVQVTVRDGDSPAATTRTAQVDVVAVNSAPEPSFPSVATAISEGEAARILDLSATCVDEDSDNFAGGQLTVGFDGFHEPDDLLAFAPTATITIAGIEINHAVGGKLGEWSGGGSDPLVVVLGANATPDRVRDLLRAVTMRNTSEDPTAGTRVVQATLSDGDGGSGSAVIGVYVAPVNDPPAVTIGASTITWRQGDPPIAIDPAAGCADVDSGDFAGGRLTASIAAGADASDRLTLVAAGPIAVAGTSVTWSGTEIGTVSGGDSGTTPLVVTLDADATPTRVRDLLRCLSYASAAALPATQSRTVAIIVEDGDGGASTQRTRIVQVERVNLPPVLTLSGGTAAYTEDAPAVVVDAGATVFDGDSDDLDGGRLTIAVTGMVASDHLDLPDQGTPGFGIGRSGATVTWGGYPIGTVAGGAGEPLVVDLLAAASDERVQDLLRVVTYATTAQNPPATRTITAVLSDGDGGTSVPVQRTVAITAVNDPPSASPTVLTVAGQTATGRWTAVDPEGDTVTWSVEAQPANGALSTSLAGVWTFVPTSAAAGSATVRATDNHGAYADFVVPVLVSGPADPRPAPASDPPLSAQIGTTWTWELAVAGDIAASPNLEVEAIGASGLVGLTVSAPVGRSVTIAWPVPGSETAGTNKRFHLRISDRSSGRSALVPVMIHLRALIGGGG
jgi:hypothetical protein